MTGAVLVTRPQPDNDATIAALRSEGYDALAAPMLRFEAVTLRDDPAARFGAIIMTSVNAVRALATQPAFAVPLDLPLYAIGDKTAAAAREAGFRNVIAADGDAATLRNLIASDKPTAKKLKSGDPLLYLAGADLARDLAGELGARGFDIVTQTIYRMTPVVAFPVEIVEAFSAGAVAAVLHYSRRSARAFLAAARTAGVEISALSLPQCCLSDAVAGVLRDAGAGRVMAARNPEEAALFALLDRAVTGTSR